MALGLCALGRVAFITLRAPVVFFFIFFIAARAPAVLFFFFFAAFIFFIAFMAFVVFIAFIGAMVASSKVNLNWLLANWA